MGQISDGADGYLENAGSRAGEIPRPQPGSIWSMLARSIDAAPDRTALVKGDRRLTYAQLGEAIDRLAGNLIDLG